MDCADRDHPLRMMQGREPTREGMQHGNATACSPFQSRRRIICQVQRRRQKPAAVTIGATLVRAATDDALGHCRRIDARFRKCQGAICSSLVVWKGARALPPLQDTLFTTIAVAVRSKSLGNSDVLAFVSSCETRAAAEAWRAYQFC
jgi:hypothetical protein